MRKFTISSRMQEYEFKLIEQKVGIKLPVLFFNFLSTYGGMFIEEKSWKMEEINFSFIYNYLDELREELNLTNIQAEMIPFANEESGWLFCISTEQNYPVYIFKTTNYSGKNAFMRISESFNDFISNLYSESNNSLQ